MASLAQLSHPLPPVGIRQDETDQYASSSDSSDNESPSTSFCSSNKHGSKPGTPAPMPKKPAEVFRKDLISAMKLPDSHHVSPEDYYLLGRHLETGVGEGVQGAGLPRNHPTRLHQERSGEAQGDVFTLQKRYIQCWTSTETDTLTSRSWLRPCAL
ncbi:protein Jade-3 [Salvelinus sp. IW2-2015]|uniref:protein Jade-3 n=1 Tax=Salvelinus sp. IW2-2015 TaxID=2691554 RepID=UPI0038D3B52C